MALIKCPECGKEISDKAEACVYCGFPIKSNLEIKRICPECKNNVENGISICPTCGFDLKADKWECVECHAFVDNNVDECPKCVASRALTISDKTNADSKRLDIRKKKIIGLVMIIAACVLFVIGFTRINNSHIKFYKQHYEECKEGYYETKATANSYGSGFFNSSYNSIANSYKKMMNSDMKKINFFRIQAGVCWATGIGLLVIGIKKMKG